MLSLPEAMLPPALLPYIDLSERPLNPMQVEAIPRVLASRRNIVIAAATGAGKTLVAEAALLQECRIYGRTGVYLAPMRAIAAEKHDDWQRLAALGLRIYKTTGEDDAFDPAQARDADIIVATPEKWDSISRRQATPDLVERIGTIVMDEVHLVGDGQRGAGQEAMLARLPLLFPGARLVAMSGTLANADAVARWLDADLYESRWRPIALVTRVQPYRPGGGRATEEEARNRITARIVGETANEGASTLVFCGSRLGVASCAEYLAGALDIPGPRPPPRLRNETLRRVVARGVAFHHAGLEREDRAAVERLFRAGGVRVLVATSTVAAGVNLPARAVVVRDLQLGTSEIGASTLLQMAGRAGRPGLETEGRCFVVAPEGEVDRVKTMMGGEPVASMLAEDLATHANTEIALGLARSREDLRAWYRRTLHFHVAKKAADVDAAAKLLLKDGFVVETPEGLLEPTTLGLATTALMIRVDTAAALDKAVAALADSLPDRSDPDALEHELLLAACGLPSELDGAVSRAPNGGLVRALGARDARLREWAPGRLDYLAAAVCVLTGVPVERLDVEAPRSLQASVQHELPRYLSFMARRGAERDPGAPPALVAADLASALEYGVVERGAGVLLEALRRVHGRSGSEARKRMVLAEYTAMRLEGVRSLDEASERLDPSWRGVAAARAQARAPLPLSASATHLVAHPRPARRSVRTHIRVAWSDKEAIWSSDLPAGREAVDLIPLARLGPPGARGVLVKVEIVSGSPSSPQAWTYASGETTVVVPGPAIALQAVDALLRAPLSASSPSASTAPSSPSASTAPSSPSVSSAPSLAGATTSDDVQDEDDVVLKAMLTRYRMTAADYRRLVFDVPPAVPEAAALVANALPDPAMRIDAVTALLQRRVLDPARKDARPLETTRGVASIGGREGAELATALLWALGLPARPLVATFDGAPSMVCAVLHDGRWWWLPLWPDAPFMVHHRTIVAWRDGGRGAATARPVEGWSVLRQYLTLSPRFLPLGGAIVSLGAASPLDAEGSSSEASCPTCGAPMRERSGRNGRFLGCSRYPACTTTRPLTLGS